jgi:hypothetical protein
MRVPYGSARVRSGDNELQSKAGATGKEVISFLYQARDRTSIKKTGPYLNSKIFRPQRLIEAKGLPLNNLAERQPPYFNSNRSCNGAIPRVQGTTVPQFKPTVPGFKSRRTGIQNGPYHKENPPYFNSMTTRLRYLFSMKFKRSDIFYTRVLTDYNNNLLVLFAICENQR